MLLSPPPQMFGHVIIDNRKLEMMTIGWLLMVYVHTKFHRNRLISSKTEIGKRWEAILTEMKYINQMKFITVTKKSNF
jgi:hypothetical protein